MPDNISRDTIFVNSRMERKYDILQKQNYVIIKRRPTPSILPEYTKPRPLSPIRKKPVKPTQIVPEKQEVKKVEQKVATVQNEVSIESPISNSMSFADLQKKVEELRAKEKEKQQPQQVEEKEEEIPAVIMEDADDLANGTIIEEQELINKKYLKTLDYKTLKRVYYVATGNQATKDTTKYEMRKEILDKYKEANSSRKQVIYESSREQQ